LAFPRRWYMEPFVLLLKLLSGHWFSWRYWMPNTYARAWSLLFCHRKCCRTIGFLAEIDCRTCISVQNRRVRATKNWSRRTALGGWPMQVGIHSMWRPRLIENRWTSRLIFAFSATAVHATIIQHDGQDVAGRCFENVKICQLLFWGAHQDRHAIAMSRGDMRKMLDLSTDLRCPSSGHVCIRIL